RFSSSEYADGYLLSCDGSIAVSARCTDGGGPQRLVLSLRSRSQPGSVSMYFTTMPSLRLRARAVLRLQRMRQYRPRAFVLLRPLLIESSSIARSRVSKGPSSNAPFRRSGEHGLRR